MVAIGRGSNEEPLVVVGRGNMQKGGWFSSLRRQPKGGAATKGKAASENKTLQKSCVDLSTDKVGGSGEWCVRNGAQITCGECHRYYVPTVFNGGTGGGGGVGGKSLDEVVRNAINSKKIGAKFSEVGTASVNKTVNVERTEEVRRGDATAEGKAEFTERITVTQTTVIKKPAKRIEFFQLSNGGRNAAVLDGDTMSTRSEGSIGINGGGGGGGKTVTFSSNRNGLVFDEDGKVLGNSLNFDFEFIDEDRLSTKSPTPPPASANSTPTTPPVNGGGVIGGGEVGGAAAVGDIKALIKMNNAPPVQPKPMSMFGVNTCKLGSSINICDNCLGKRFKSRSDWNISSSKVQNGKERELIEEEIHRIHFNDQKKLLEMELNG